MTEFWLGIASGIASSILIYTFVYFLPWMRKCLSKEANIAKSWYWFDETNENTVGQMILKQNGSNIRGVFKRNLSRDDIPTDRTFKLRGTLFGGQLLLTYFEPRNPRTIMGVLVLRVSNHVKFIVGRTMYLDHEKNKVTTHPFVFCENNEIDKSLHPYFTHVKSPNFAEVTKAEKLLAQDENS